MLELKPWAERRLGEILGETVRQGRPRKKTLHDERFLPEGVSRTQAHRYQEAAIIYRSL